MRAHLRAHTLPVELGTNGGFLSLWKSLASPGMGRTNLSSFPLRWDPLPAFQPPSRAPCAPKMSVTYLGTPLRPRRAPRWCCPGSTRRWSGCSAPPGGAAGWWPGLWRKAERHSGYFGCLRAAQCIEQPAAPLQNQGVLAGMLGKGWQNEVPALARGTKQGHGGTAAGSHRGRLLGW